MIRNIFLISGRFRMMAKDCIEAISARLGGGNSLFFDYYNVSTPGTYPDWRAFAMHRPEDFRRSSVDFIAWRLARASNLMS